MIKELTALLRENSTDIFDRHRRNAAKLNGTHGAIPINDVRVLAGPISVDVEMKGIQT